MLLIENVVRTLTWAAMSVIQILWLVDLLKEIKTGEFLLESRLSRLVQVGMLILAVIGLFIATRHSGGLMLEVAAYAVPTGLALWLSLFAHHRVAARDNKALKQLNLWFAVDAFATFGFVAASGALMHVPSS